MPAQVVGSPHFRGCHFCNHQGHSIGDCPLKRAKDDAKEQAEAMKKLKKEA